jgi:hypothetical protein
MSDRARNAVLIVVLGVWAIVCCAYLVQGKLPDAALLTVPAAVILALGFRRGPNQEPGQADPAPTQTTATEGETP